MSHNATLGDAELKLWNESGTNRVRIGDSHPAYRRLIKMSSLAPVTRHYIKPIMRPRDCETSAIVNSWSRDLRGKSQQDSLHVAIIPSAAFCTTGSPRAPNYCVFAVVRTVAVDTNWVASSAARPIGVGTVTFKGAITRVPAIGASQTSMSRCAAMYLIAARSGM